MIFWSRLVGHDEVRVCSIDLVCVASGPQIRKHSFRPWNLVRLMAVHKCAGNSEFSSGTDHKSTILISKH